MAPDIDFQKWFDPRSIAIVGVSRSEIQKVIGGSGLSILRALRKAGYAGHVYPINPNASEIDGVPAYPSLKSVPGPIDLVIVAVPAEIVPQVLEDCIALGLLNVHVCSSGFSETGEEKGRVLEDQIRQIALRGGLRLLGPNCMGVMVPKIRMAGFQDYPLVDGPVAFLSQSGGHASSFIQYGPSVGVGFSKVVSFGNAILTDETDFLEYLGSDPDTRVICLYLEGARKGKLLTSLVRKINLVKPVVIWKGGMTDFGARAAASHTGSLAGNRQTWGAFFKQTSAIQVSSIEDMAEVCAALVHLPPSVGKRALVISGGGGNNVAAGDICAEEGIELLPLSARTKEELGKFLSSVNQGLTNPLEAPNLMFSPDDMRRAMRIFNIDQSIDMVIVSLLMSSMARRGIDTPLLNCLADMTKGKDITKPVIVTLSDPVNEAIYANWERVGKAGVPWYRTLRQACRALSKAASYHEYLNRARKTA